MQLDTARAVVGQPITGVLIVTNPGASIDRPHQCHPTFAVALTNSVVPPDGPVSDLMCHARPFTLAHGTNRLPFNVPTDYPGCFQPPGGPAMADSPVCLAGPRIPPLPPGTYRAVMLTYTRLLPKAQSVAVHLRS